MQQKLILCTSSFHHPYSLLLGHYRTTTAKSSKKIPKIKLKNMLNKTKSYNHWLRNVPQGTGTSNFIACEQALQVTLMARWEKEVELATTSLEFNFLPIPLRLPVDWLSDFRQSVRSGNKHESKQTLKNTSQG